MPRTIAALSFLTLLFVASLAQAADDPTGTWKWKTKFQDQEREMTLKLKLEGDKLTGSMPGRDNQETAIEEGSFKDGTVTFKVTRERNGNKFVSKYSAKLSGDTLKGTIESERNGQTNKREFEATRAKE
jgi:hypothetical protein